MPLVLFLVIGNAYDGQVAGVSATTWYMINMGVFGAMERFSAPVRGSPSSATRGGTVSCG